MENIQHNGDKMPSPPSQMPQQQPSVPSIFLAPANANNPPQQQMDNNTSTNQTTQTSLWNSGSGMEMQRVRSPTNITSSTTSISGGGGSIMDLYKMKSCASTQCGSYEGLGGNMQMGGGGGGCHLQSMQSRLYPPSYIQQQQQQQMTNMTMPIRSMHQHHHHHGISAQCHPHYAQQSMNGSGPHLADRMIHSVATASSSTGNGGAYMSDPHNHNHHHHHHGHGGGISAAAAAAAQYAHQQQQHQRMVSSASLNPYRQLPIPTHHQQKVINASQAAAAYQSAYQHQYNQYHGMVHSHSAAAAAAGSSSLNPYYRQLPTTHQQLTSSQAYQSAYQHHHHSAYQYHHGGMISHSHSHPHHQNTGGGPSATGGVAGVVQQRMLGIPIASAQQHQQQQQTHRMVPYISRTCQPHLLTSSNYQQAGAQHQHQQQQQLVNHLEASSSVGAGGAGGGVSNTTMSTTQVTSTDLNNNSNSGKSAATSSTTISGTKSLNKKASTEQLIVCSQKGLHGSSLKIKLSSTNTASPEKSVKIKATRSVTKLRDRQQRLAIGQKKKSVCSGISGSSGGSSSRKLKSLKALNAAIERDCSGAGKRLTSTLVEGIEGNGDAKRSRKIGKSGGGGGEVVISGVNSGGVSVRDSEGGTEESSEKGGRSAGGEEETSTSVGGDLNRSATDNYFLEEQNGDEYMPTPEEMRKYLERLNTCNNLKIPLYYAYSVFHGKLALSKKDNNNSSEDSGSTTAAEGTITATTILYHQYHPQELNFSSYYNNNWDDTNNAAAAESEWQQFQDDMAVLEAYFPLLSTMEQSERAEKLDTIYSYEGQMKLINSAASPPVPSGTCPVVGVVGDQISPPCNCVTVQDVQAQECSCCYNYLALSHHPMASSPEELAEQIACRNSSFVGGESPQQFVLEGGYPPQPHYMSTPLSSRRQYAGGSHFYDEENGYYFRDMASNGGAAVTGLGTMKARIGARKRSSSFPSRKSGRRNSGSRDHLKSETESFLDELISTANEEKMSKNKNNSGEVTAPEIQCEVDFPSLASSAAVPYNKRQAKKSKPEETLSARDEYLVSSSTNSSGGGTEESESNGSACSSSSPQSTHNTSSDGDFEGTTEITLLDNNGCIAGTTTIVNPSKRNHRSVVLSSSSCGHFAPDESGGDPAVCCPSPRTGGGVHHLWDEFRGDEMITVPRESYRTTCIPVSSINHLIAHCTCRRGEAICPTRPPPGFEHLSRPAFPIELYDSTLLGSLIGAQLPREVLASLDASQIPKQQFEEVEEFLLSLTCCEKHAVDKMLRSRKLTSKSSSMQTQETEGETSAQQESSAEGEERKTQCDNGDNSRTETEDEWELLDRAIKLVLHEWTEELGFRRRMNDILYSLNLQEMFGGCCKRTDLPDQTHQTSATEQMENVHYIFGSSSSLSRSFASDDSSSILLRSGTTDP